jgi:hypothetical protein
MQTPAREAPMALVTSTISSCMSTSKRSRAAMVTPGIPPAARTRGVTVA